MPIISRRLYGDTYDMCKAVFVICTPGSTLKPSFKALRSWHVLAKADGQKTTSFQHVYGYFRSRLGKCWEVSGKSLAVEAV